uniref:Uncharacterized protein n=1 Tax=Arundo donax TaxID=35708 RepID=A0A0A9FHU5_ARUDO
MVSYTLHTTFSFCTWTSEIRP